MNPKREIRNDPYERFRRSGYVCWSELTDEAKQRLLTAGHPSNRPSAEVIESDQCRFRPDGSGWIAGFAL